MLKLSDNLAINIKNINAVVYRDDIDRVVIYTNENGNNIEHTSSLESYLTYIRELQLSFVICGEFIINDNRLIKMTYKNGIVSLSFEGNFNLHVGGGHANIIWNQLC